VTTKQPDIGIGIFNVLGGPVQAVNEFILDLAEENSCELKVKQQVAVEGAVLLDYRIEVVDLSMGQPFVRKTHYSGFHGFRAHIAGGGHAIIFFSEGLVGFQDVFQLAHVAIGFSVQDIVRGDEITDIEGALRDFGGSEGRLLSARFAGKGG